MEMTLKEFNEYVKAHVPKGVTNGDMMIAIYGIADVEVNERSVRLFPKDGGQLWVTRDWWEAPYKRGNTDE